MQSTIGVQATIYRLTLYKLQTPPGESMLAFDSAAELSSREVSDFLHKLVNDSAWVRIVLTVGGSPSMSATVVGKLRFATDGVIWVVSNDKKAEAQLTFKPSLAVLRRFGEEHAFGYGPGNSSAAAFFPSVTLIFADRSQVSLMELAEKPGPTISER